MPGLCFLAHISFLNEKNRNHFRFLASAWQLDQKHSPHLSKEGNSPISSRLIIGAKTFSYNGLHASFICTCLQYNEHECMHLRSFRSLAGTWTQMARCLSDLLWAIQTLNMSEAGESRFPCEILDIPSQTVTNAKTDFSQRSGYSPSKLHNTCLWRRLPWPVCNSSPWAFPGAECNVSMFRRTCWLHNERQKHLSVVWFMNEVMSSFCSWKTEILQFGLRLQV